MQFEDAFSGRASFFEGPDLFQVRIDRKRSPWLTAFSAIWLCGWAFGEFIAIQMLLFAEVGAMSFFLLAWLGGWTIGGVFVFSQLMWGLAGYELLSLSKEALTLERRARWFSRSWNYDTTHLKNIRVSEEAQSAMSFFGNRNLQGLFSGREQGTVKFDYGLKTRGFGLELDEAEARVVADRLSGRLHAT